METLRLEMTSAASSALNDRAFIFLTFWFSSLRRLKQPFAGSFPAPAAG